MTTSGTKIMASGNLFKWEKVDSGHRGGVHGSFTSEPSAADIAEGHAYARTLAPSGVTVAEGVVETCEQVVKSALDQFVFGGQRN